MTEPPASDRQAPNFYDANLLPPAPVGTPRRWAVRLGLWFCVALLFSLALKYDLLLMQWRYTIFPEGPKGVLKQILYGFRDFGQIMPIFVAILIVLRVDKRRWTVITCILMAQVLAGIGYNTTKLSVARYRPHHAIEQVGQVDKLQFDQVWLGFRPVVRESELQSFPSGHSAAAFAFAGIMAWFFPRIGPIMWFMAAGCALSRYVDGVHWLSDCIAGAAVGYLGAWLTLRPYAWAVPYWIIRRWKACRAC